MRFKKINNSFKHFCSIAVILLLFAGCEDDFISNDTSITKSVEDDYFSLYLTVSEDIVSKYEDIKIDVQIIRKMEHADLGSRVLGDWKVTQEVSGTDTLKFTDSDSTIGAATELESGTTGDSTWSITTQGSVYTDSARTITYTFSNDYTFSYRKSVVYTDSTVTTTDTSYTWSSGSSNTFSKDTTAATDSVVTTRSGEWSYTSETTQLSFKFLDVVGGESDSGAVSFDTELATIPIGAYMVFSGAAKSITFEKTGTETGFDLPDEASSTNLYVSAHAGYIYVQNSSTGAAYKSFSIDLGTAKNSMADVTCFFQTTSSSETEGYISASYSDLEVSIPIYIQ